MRPWANRAYGCHPVYVFLEPSSPEIIEWDLVPGRDNSRWEWLAVGLNEAVLYPDLALLRDLTKAALAEVGYWWGMAGPVPGAEPAQFSPFLDGQGFLSYEF
jgi:hypothetical protein